MTWLTLAKLSRSFASFFTTPPENTDPIEDPPQIDSRKLARALPGVIGKTIAEVVIIARPRGRSQLYLIFTDRTHYEFYGIDTMSGARQVDAGGLRSTSAEESSSR